MPASLEKKKKRKFSLKCVAVCLIKQKGNPNKLGFLTVFSMCRISLGKLDEKPLVLLCGWVCPAAVPGAECQTLRLQLF